MAKKEKTETKPLTRAEKTEAAKVIIRELLKKGETKNNDLIDEAAKIYAQRFGGEDNENPNDVKGRVGSVINVMKKDEEITFDGGMYALKTEKETEKPVKKTAKKKEEKKEENIAVEEKPKAKRTKKTKAKAEGTPVSDKEKAEPLPAAPMQPIAPVAPITPETAPEPIPEEKTGEKTEEKPAPKKRGRKAKAAEVKEEKEEKTPEKTEEKPVDAQPVQKQEETPAPVAESKAETKAEEKPEQPAHELIDMSFLFGAPKAAPKAEVKPVPVEPKKETVTVAPKAENKPAVKAEKPQEVKKESKPESKPQVAEKPKKETQQKATPVRKTVNAKPVQKPKTADEKLQDAFLSRLRKLGGDYFEYYSVYLLEKYSRMNGRRLEGLKISGGEHDGGIDGEIELSDRLGFKETIYIQAKNWDPDKGDERLWVVGETLVQQFIGACVCRKAKDGKQNCRGIFITTSRFTPEAKKILNEMSDTLVGYDGADLFETAKECQFGLIKKNGEWTLDEDLLAGEKAFFRMF